MDLKKKTALICVYLTSVLFLMVSQACSSVSEEETALPSEWVRITAERTTYSVGENIEFQVEFLIAPRERMRISREYPTLVIIPEIRGEDGRSVPRFPTGPSEGFRSDIPRRPGPGRSNIITWKIEDREWKNSVTGEVYFKGVGVTAGSSPIGRFFFQLNRVPGRYTVIINRYLFARDSNMYYELVFSGDDILKEKHFTSNALTIEILPRKTPAVGNTGK